MSNSVIHSLRHSSLRLVSLLFLVATHMQSLYLDLRKSVGAVSQCEGAKLTVCSRLQSVSLFTQRHQRANHANSIDLSPPPLVPRCTPTASARREEKQSRVKCSRSRVDCFPTGEANGDAARVLVCVRVVIDWHVCEPVNHTTSAQMPLGGEATNRSNKLQMVQMA